MREINDLSKVTEPCILVQLRTPEGREMRRKGVELFKFKAYYPRADGIANTLTSVEKDNYLLIPPPSPIPSKGDTDTTETV